MDASEKTESYFAKSHRFKNGIGILRDIAGKTTASETFKWGSPVYTIENKNVFGIIRFKEHFGVWFFNGVFLSDPKKVLENAQDGKTKAMRHWKFYSEDAIDPAGVLAYMQEAVENQKKGRQWKPEKKSGAVIIPEILQAAFREQKQLKAAFDGLTPFRQREYCEFLSEAKQLKTKMSRLNKIRPLIEKRIGLNDKYRKNQ